MARLGGLGKGLGALIPSDIDATQQLERPTIDDPGATTPMATDTAAATAPRLAELPVDALSPNPNQPRVHFDEELLEELAASIREIGVLQPVLVRASGPGVYELIAGERRWRAARRAGLTTIPAIVRITGDLQSVEQALVENLHRQDLTPLEEAAAYQQLIEDFNLTHEQVSSRVGKSRSAVSNTLRLLTLPPSIQHLLADGRLSAGHARALLGSPDRAFQEYLAKRAVDDSLSVRAVEEAIRDRQAGGAGSPDDAVPPVTPTADGAGLTPVTRLRPPGLLELEHLLAEHLDTKVAVSMGARRGRVSIEFADLEDLERIYRQMVEPTTRD
ncbi:MAG TPA: ParB/RepB/Spo0J family partition protein [Ilumatobacteraceae bacterium]|nr:ParB/RepB/Spo0J family partition protein [Ilumatobacteraceae bacterium]